MTMDLLWLALIGFAGFSVASAAQAATGFGGALVAVPVFALLVDVPTAVVAATGLGFLMTAGAGIVERAHVDRRTAVRFFVAGLVGMPLGLLLLARLDERLLDVLVALTVLAALPLVLRTAALVRRRSLDLAAGGLSGLLLTSTGMNGPPLVVVLQGSGCSPRAMRATLQVVFAGQDLVALAGFALIGRLSPEVGALVLGGALAIPLGWRLGDRLLRVMTPQQFRRGVIGLLVASALTLLGQALLSA